MTSETLNQGQSPIVDLKIHALDFDQLEQMMNCKAENVCKSTTGTFSFTQLTGGKEGLLYLPVGGKQREHAQP